MATGRGQFNCMKIPSYCPIFETGRRHASPILRLYNVPVSTRQFTHWGKKSIISLFFALSLAPTFCMLLIFIVVFSSPISLNDLITCVFSLSLSSCTHRATMLKAYVPLSFWAQVKLHKRKRKYRTTLGSRKLMWKLQFRNSIRNLSNRSKSAQNWQP